MAQAPNTAPGTQGKNAYIPLIIPESRNHLEEPTLPSDASRTRPFKRSSRLPDTDRDDPTGLRIFTVTLKPKEKLECHLKAPSASQINLSFSLYPRFPRMNPQIQAANLPPLPTREHTIQIENAQNEPQKVLLYLSGMAGYPYTLDLTRTAGN